MSWNSYSLILVPLLLSLKLPVRCFMHCPFPLKIEIEYIHKKNCELECILKFSLLFFSQPYFSLKLVKTKNLLNISKRVRNLYKIQYRLDIFVIQVTDLPLYWEMWQPCVKEKKQLDSTFLFTLIKLRGFQLPMCSWLSLLSYHHYLF